MEGVWSSHTEAALLILGLGSILTRQYLRAAKAWQVHGKGRGREVQPVPTGGSTPAKIPPLQNLSSSTATHIQVHVGVKLPFFLKILKQQIMVRTFSTLFQTMMRCYSSLRAGRGHILSFPIPVQQVIPTDRHGFKVAMKHLTQRGLGNGQRTKSRKSLTEWDGHSKDKKKAELEVEEEIT